MGDPIDSPLGSTAISGSVSTLVYLKRTEDRRTFQTRQRIGQDLPETVLTFDTVTRSLSVGGTRLEADRHGCEEEILDYLTASGGQKTEPEIVKNVGYKTAVNRQALRSLRENGAVTYTGSGKKGGHSNIRLLVPALYLEPRNKNV